MPETPVEKSEFAFGLEPKSTADYLRNLAALIDDGLVLPYSVARKILNHRSEWVEESISLTFSRKRPPEGAVLPGQDLAQF